MSSSYENATQINLPMYSTLYSRCIAPCVDFEERLKSLNIDTVRSPRKRPYMRIVNPELCRRNPKYPLPDYTIDPGPVLFHE